MHGRVCYKAWLRVVVLVLPFIAIEACDELPDDVSISDIPEYYHPYLEKRVEAINNAIAECVGGSETFLWITDIHWEPDLNTRKSPALIKYIASQTGITKILNGGDTGNSKVICENAISQLRKAIGSDRVYSVTGNHEINDASRYERPFMRVANELRGHNNDIVYGDADRSYFYFDNQDDKIRYIGLSSFGLFLNNEYESCYTAEQLEWFTQTALDVEKGWTIIIFTHALYNVKSATDKLYIAPAGANGFINAIDNYKGEGIIACVLIGHTHRDRIHIGTTGIPYIISSCDRYASYHGDINVDRTPGTITEQHFEVVVIDKVAKKIKLLSIGGKARDGYDDDPGNEVDVRTIGY